MTDLLEKAVAQIEKMPEDVQDAIAARLLADLADEEAWAAGFAATTEAQWERMAGWARRQVDAEDTILLDELFPPTNR